MGGGGGEGGLVVMEKYKSSKSPPIPWLWIGSAKVRCGEGGGGDL